MAEKTTSKSKPRRDGHSQEKGRYTSVSEFLESTLDDGDPFVEEFNERLRSRDVVKTLQTMRVASGMSQVELAEHLGCTQGRISKLETGLDEDLKLRDIEGYAKALQRDAHLMFSKRNETSLDRIKRHAFAIHDELVKLALLAKKDHDIAKGVAETFGEVLFNQVRLLQVAAEKLPVDPVTAEPSLHVSVHTREQPSDLKLIPETTDSLDEAAGERTPTAIQ